jgi:hypothetical protein
MLGEGVAEGGCGFVKSNPKKVRERENEIN